MDRLISIIGPAPSELSQEDLFVRLRKERDRVREALIAFRESTSFRQSRTKAKAPKVDPLAAIAAAAGLSPEELRKLISAEMKGELG